MLDHQPVGCAVVEADARLGGEAFPTDAADKRPFSSVDTVGVDLQRSRLGEAFPALAAVVGLLSRVDPLVRPDSRQMRKRAAAEVTRVRPFTCVNAPVDLQRPRLAEALAAVWAGVRPGPRVHVEVDAEVAVRVEGPAAFCAEEARRLVGVLGTLVLQQLVGPGKRGRAVHARVQQRRAPDSPPRSCLRLWVCFLGAFSGTSGQRVSAAQAGHVWDMRADERRAGQAGRQGAVVVVEMMVGVGKGRVRAALGAQQPRAAVEALSTRLLPLLLAGTPGFWGAGAAGPAFREEMAN